MKTAVFIGLIAIAQAIKGQSLFDAELSLDVIITSLLASVFMFCDVIDGIKKISKKE